MIPLQKERTIIARLGIGLALGAIRTYGETPENPLDHLIIAAVVLGTLESKPLTGHKVGRVSGPPSCDRSKASTGVVGQENSDHQTGWSLPWRRPKRSENAHPTSKRLSS
jgi:hypothetical protein